ncbi:MAG: B12-binding domain-containing radical SAM protein [Lachnospiraceae bacterium]|nr:B12-binding domain-containing radical SAM protein [Lachnospiraceae bacterium]
MKTLLVAINAKYIHSNPAIYDLRAYAKPYQEQIELAEYTINHYMEDILIDIYKKKPQLIAISCYIWNIRLVRELGQNLNKLLPQVPIWLGGPEVSFESREFLKEEVWASGIMAGEGEQTFLELMAYYQEQKGSLNQIQGLVYRDLADHIQVNPPRNWIDLNQVPFAYEDLSGFENRIIYYETSRGCPFSCSYCLSSVEKKVRFRDMEKIREELMFFLKKKVQQVKFVDRTFNCNKEHALQIWRFIMEHDNGITNFHFEIGADLLGEEELELLSAMRPGLIQLEIGVQSANPHTIKEIRRQMDLDKLETVVGILRRKGNIHQHLDLIAGLPYEDYQSFQKSFDRVYHMKPDQLQLGFLKVLKGSWMYENAQSYGLGYKEEANYEVLYTKWLSYDDIIQLKAVEHMLEMYYNSGQFQHTLNYFIEKYNSAFHFYKELAIFYEEKNRQMQKLSRLGKYDLLLEFLIVRFPEFREQAREYLTLDLYAREKVKSRPVWAKDLSPYKNQIRQFYKQEEQDPIYLPEYRGYQAKQMAGMTHIEVFTKIYAQETAVLFNYAAKDPRSKEADMCEIML